MLDYHHVNYALMTRFMTCYTTLFPVFQELLTLLDSLKDLGSLQSEHSKELNDLKAEQKALTAEIEAMRGEMNQTQERILFQRKKVKEMEDRLNNKGKELEKQRTELEAYCERTRSLLGLDVAVTEDNSYVFRIVPVDGGDVEGKDKECVCEIATSYEEGEKPFKSERERSKYECFLI